MLKRFTVALFMTAVSASAADAELAQDRMWALMAERLFPAVEVLEPDRLPASTSEILSARRRRMTSCRDDVRCRITAARWTDNEIKILADAAPAAINPTAAYVPPDDGIKGEVARQLEGLNGILDVYGLGTPPRYPEADGPKVISDRPPASQAIVEYAVELADAGKNDPVTKLDPSIALAIGLLDANDRSEPIAFEPLDRTINAAAAAQAKFVYWSSFAYSAILVLGIGPDDLATPLSARSKLNLRIAAQSFADGTAPFLIVSGSNVHPRGTRFVEALQMREALIGRYGIPANRIIVDPYARHTTTNIRNATRRLISIGAAMSKDLLIISNPDHITYIAGPDFLERSRTELGYQPARVIKRTASTAVTVRPSISSLRVDPMDPLDP